MGLYSMLVRPLAFRLEAEQAHQLALKLGETWRGRGRSGRAAIAEPRLATTVAGIRFPHPIGLAAGYDKSGQSAQNLAALALAAVDRLGDDRCLGRRSRAATLTPADDRAVWCITACRMRRPSRETAHRKPRLPVPPGSISRSPIAAWSAPPLKDDAIIEEYVAAARMLAPHADYLMLNMSCPNTEDGRDFFVDRPHIEACLAALGTLGLTIPCS